MKSITQKAINACFEGKTKQEDVIIALYRIVFPEWDRISQINNWPKVSRTTSLFIGRKFIDFDREFHPDVMNGGLWLNNGFSTLDSESMPNWKADVSKCEITYL